MLNRHKVTVSKSNHGVAASFSGLILPEFMDAPATVSSNSMLLIDLGPDEARTHR